jgi:hypothetical protein
MSCPYFDPVQPRGAAGDARFAMLPLGDSWSGNCLAGAQGPASPDALPLSVCNLGYARDSCGRFPGGEGPDAARFSISADDGTAVRVAWVLERDHHPFDHGSITFLRADSIFQASQVSPAVLRLAGAYVARYLEAKSAQLEGK